MQKFPTRLLSLALVVLMVVSMLPASVFAAETEKTLPDATVSTLAPITLTAAEHDYMVWPSGDDTIDRPLEIVMNFKAEDTLEECLTGGYSEWLTDFNLTVSGMTSGSIIADNCYLAGNYGTFGWVVIPTDGLELLEGETYPVVAAYDASLNYADICKSVQNFTAAIHIDQAILDANPDMQVKLELVMTNPEDPDDKLVIGEPAIYTAEDLTNKKLPEATVTVLGKQTLTDYDVWMGGQTLVAGEGAKPVEVVLNFKAEDTLEECLTGGYSKWLTDFYITVDGLAEGSVTGTNSYLAGNYGTYGWIVIPLDETVVENGVTYPVVSNYDATLNYKDICKSVKDFTAAIHIDQAILDANPDMTVTLELKMTNPEDASDVLLIGEPAVYNVEALSNGARVQNKDTGVLYTKIKDAMDEAEKGETVKLLDNVTEEEIMLRRERSLDLNGYELIATEVAVPYATSHIIDSTDGQGKLYITRDSLAVNENNAQLPLWDEDGFRFVNLAFNQRASLKSGENGNYAYFRFYITGDDADCVLAQQMADGGADNGVTIQVKLSWKNATGEETFRYFYYDDEEIVKYATNWTGKMFYLNVTGVDTVTDLRLTAVAVSNANEEANVVINGESVAPA